MTMNFSKPFLPLFLFILILGCIPKDGSLLNSDGTSQGGGTAQSGYGHGDSVGENEGGARQNLGFLPSIKNYWNQFSKIFKWDKLANYVSRLGRMSKSYCARGVRIGLNLLLGRPENSGQGSDTQAACQYNTNVLNGKFRRPGFKWVEVTDNPRSFAPGDVVACRSGAICGTSKTTAGHLEMFSPSGWHSDFQEGGSLCLGNKKQFQQAHQYRMVQESGVAIRLEKLKSMLSFASLNLSQAASSRGQTPTSQLSSQQVFFESFGEFSLEEIRTVGGDSTTFIYKLWKGNGADKTLFKESGTNAFQALRSSGNPQAARGLANLYVKSWVREAGLGEVQRLVLDSVLLDSLEKDAYLDNGIKLPKTYRIIDAPVL